MVYLSRASRLEVLLVFVPLSAWAPYMAKHGATPIDKITTHVLNVELLVKVGKSHPSHRMMSYDCTVKRLIS